MNCNDFDDWLQEQLDERSSLQMSDEVWHHVDRCDHCQGHWNAWKQIAASLPVDDRRDTVAKVPAGKVPVLTSARDAIGFVAAVAVIMLVSFFIQGSETATQSVAFIHQNHAIDDASSTGNDRSDITDRVLLSEHSPRLDAVAEPVGGSAARRSPDMDPSRWWRQVQSRDWIAQTMPAMQSVRDGVAPLGRSLVNAVTILAIGSRERTS